MRRLVLILAALLCVESQVDAARLFTAGHIGAVASSNQSEWFQTTGTPEQSTTIVKPGERYALKIGGTTDLVTGTRRMVGQRPLGAPADNDDYFYVFHLYVVERPSAPNAIFANGTGFFPSGEVDLRLKDTGEVELRDSAVAIFTSGVLTQNTWYCIGIRGRRVDGAGNDQLELQINGTSIGASSGRTFTSTNTFREFQIGGNINQEANTAGEWYFGSFRLNDDNGAADTSWPSCDNRVNYLLPDGVGTFSSESTESGAATDWQAIGPPPDGATTAVTFSGTSANWGAAGARLLVTASSSAAAGIGSEDTIHLAAMGWVWASVATVTTEIIPGIGVGGTGYDLATPAAHAHASASYYFIDSAINTNQYENFYTNPATTAAWTVAELNALEIGARVADTDDAILTSLWLMVEYDDNPASVSSSRGTLLGVLP